ncbi:MAG: hypothetical protein N3A72_01455 [bacterium]|nr:hypothetical protein [bacterium]
MKFITSKNSRNILQQIYKKLDYSELALVKNPAYIYAPVEIYPLVRKRKRMLPKLVGVVKDMDGTTTTTEALCLHSLEWMVRRITNRMDKRDWQGLDRERDYPHIIGNSTTKHIEYLIKRYRTKILPEAFRKAYLESVIWTLNFGKDERRRNEVIATVSAFGLDGLLQENELRSILACYREYQDEHASASRYLEKNGLPSSLLQKLLNKYGKNLAFTRFSDQVRAALDIYYQRYHTILMEVAAGRGKECARAVLENNHQRLIEPMPAVGIFIALIKGWLGEDIARFYPYLATHILAKSPRWKEKELFRFKSRLAQLGRYFVQHPVKVAVVTSSIAYEADIVLTEVFNVIREQITDWELPDKKKKELINRFSDYRGVYDSCITATDSSEIRLKPHRDLYSIALHQLGIPKSEYQYVVGFEDSESGTIAIRAAGIPICVAVPFAETAGHDLSAATYILHGQLPEAILAYNCFLTPKVFYKEIRG